MNIHLIAAARPNFMKIAPLYHALKEEEWAKPFIVHTGQHYDLDMSDAFFQDLALSEPDLHLGVGSGTHAEQTGKVMMSYEKVLMEHRPDLVIVVGDVNSTVACTLAASKMKYPKDVEDHKRFADLEQSAISNQLGKRPIVAHLEAGLRSFDRTMPEEINRLVTDALADILWTPSPDADENLLREGVKEEKISRVGNIMIDSIEMLRGVIEKQAVYSDFGLDRYGYGLVTLHRPSNVDNAAKLERLVHSLKNISDKIPLVFPIHPRTRKNLDKFGLTELLDDSPGIKRVDPMNYIRFMNLVFNSRMVITDSGGIQEETSYLAIPCVTMRPNTERPITIECGTNRLCRLDDLESEADRMFSGG